jgi:2-isopropylmalate synthase
LPQSIEIYDVTLRDGAQGPRVKFSADDQLRIVAALDEFGVSYIEGGQPGSNPKAADLFKRANDMQLAKAQMAAFGSTRHPKSTPEDDANLKALLAAETPVITIFAKTSPTHVEHVLRVSMDQNLDIIRESVSYLKSQDKVVFLDAEHFFDGYKEDSEYALAVLQASHEAGADALVLCDTNGGCLPWEIDQITTTARNHVPNAQFGIHTHNDSGCGVANTIAAVRAGAEQVQGTVNGYGERTGNANLATIIPDLQLKMGLKAVSDEQLTQLTHLSHLVAELANLAPHDGDPYVGRDAFTHKGGMHADAVRKLKSSYEHIDPVLVGNRTTISVSEMSGRSSLLQKAAELGVPLERDAPETRAVLEKIKELENQGYEFEAADASLELLMRKARGEHRTFFTLLDYRVSVAGSAASPEISEATIKLRLGDGSLMHTVSEGHGPVDALNSALRKALESTYPEVASVHLDDYKVRILDAQAATAAKTRVLIESSDDNDSWYTVGVSENIITASYIALIDSIEYKLLRTRGYATDEG